MHLPKLRGFYFLQISCIDGNLFTHWRGRLTICISDKISQYNFQNDSYRCLIITISALWLLPYFCLYFSCCLVLHHYTSSPFIFLLSLGLSLSFSLSLSFVVLGVEPHAFPMLGRCWTSESPQPCLFYLKTQYQVSLLWIHAAGTRGFWEVSVSNGQCVFLTLLEFFSPFTLYIHQFLMNSARRFKIWKITDRISHSWKT